ncbi:transcription factor bHLH30-like [Tasmannia lanceolata]|uniref:transcription factor bHLH30-like n=1 Tax=Tasmannia lanceolata TaxID=3420 RepID=UPI0040636976
MGSFSGDFGIVCGSDLARIYGEFSQNIDGFRQMGRSGSSSSSLILDCDRGELVKAPARLAQRGITDEKVKAALKNHSEAERRRRERINAHLAALRSLVPSTDKMDKAALLAEVISQVKELKRHATEISKGHTIPSDVDEVRVESNVEGLNKECFHIKASLCCEDRPELLADLQQALQALQLKLVRAEISTLGGRVKNVFVMTCEGNTNDIEHRTFAGSVHQALKAVLDRVASPEFSPTTALSNKRRRISLFESSSSSS